MSFTIPASQKVAGWELSQSLTPPISSSFVFTRKRCVPCQTFIRQKRWKSLGGGGPGCRVGGQTSPNEISGAGLVCVQLGVGVRCRAEAQHLTSTFLSFIFNGSAQFFQSFTICL